MRTVAASDEPGQVSIADLSASVEEETPRSGRVYSAYIRKKAPTSPFANDPFLAEFGGPESDSGIDHASAHASSLSDDAETLTADAASELKRVDKLRAVMRNSQSTVTPAEAEQLRKIAAAEIRSLMFEAEMARQRGDLEKSHELARRADVLFKQSMVTLRPDEESPAEFLQQLQRDMPATAGPQHPTSPFADADAVTPSAAPAVKPGVEFLPASSASSAFAAPASGSPTVEPLPPWASMEDLGGPRFAEAPAPMPAAGPAAGPAMTDECQALDNVQPADDAEISNSKARALAEMLERECVTWTAVTTATGDATADAIGDAIGEVNGEVNGDANGAEAQAVTADHAEGAGEDGGAIHVKANSAASVRPSDWMRPGDSGWADVPAATSESPETLALSDSPRMAVLSEPVGTGMATAADAAGDRAGDKGACGENSACSAQLPNICLQQKSATFQDDRRQGVHWAVWAGLGVMCVACVRLLLRRSPDSNDPLRDTIA